MSTESLRNSRLASTRAAPALPFSTLSNFAIRNCDIAKVDDPRSQSAGMEIADRMASGLEPGKEIPPEDQMAKPRCAAFLIYAALMDLRAGAFQLITEPCNEYAQSHEGEDIPHENELASWGRGPSLTITGCRMVGAEPAVGHVDDRHIEKGEDRQRMPPAPEVEPAVEERRRIR